MARLVLLMLAMTTCSLGCTTVVVKKSPTERDRGIRFNRPKPYLYIGPASVSKPPVKPEEAGDGKATPSNDSQAVGAASIQIAIELKYLPDYNEEYSIRLTPGLGAGTLGLKLEDGWNLTSVNMETDQKTAEILSSIAELTKSVGGVATGAAPGTMLVGSPEQHSINIVVDSRPDVPLGFYEAVIATDPNGCRHLFGWRYVGFLPFSGFPVNACVTEQAVACDPSEIWALVPGAGALKFDRLCNVEAGYSPDRNWPYKYQNVVDGTEASHATLPAPVPGTELDHDDRSWIDVLKKWFLKS